MSEQLSGCTTKFASEQFRRFLELRGAGSALIETIISRLTTLNKEIAGDTVRLGPGYQIGHSFFTPTDETQALDVAWYQRVVRYEIAPLLREYWFEHPEKADTWTATLSADIS